MQKWSLSALQESLWPHGGALPLQHHFSQHTPYVQSQPETESGNLQVVNASARSDRRHVSLTGSLRHAEEVRFVENQTRGFL